MYRKHSDLLGLEVVPTQSGIILTFTCIDRQNPAKKYASIHTSSQFTVVWGVGIFKDNAVARQS